MRKRMSGDLKKDNAISVSNIQEYCRNLLIRKSALFSITSTGNFYTYEGRVYSEKEFEDLYHLNLKPLATKGKNYDRTKSWLHGDKSY